MLDILYKEAENSYIRLKKNGKAMVVHPKGRFITNLKQEWADYFIKNTGNLKKLLEYYKTFTNEKESDTKLKIIDKEKEAALRNEINDLVLTPHI